MVQAKGVEPLILAAAVSKTAMYTNSNTPAYTGGYRPTPTFVTFKVLMGGNLPAAMAYIYEKLHS